MIAKELIHNSNRWRQRLNYYRRKVEKEIRERNITCSIKDRVGEYVALFTLAGEVTNATLNISLKIDEIFDFFFTNIVVANDEEANMGKNAYYTIMKYVSEHRDLFADAGFYGGTRSQFNTFDLDADKDGFIYGCRNHIVDDKVYNNIIVFRSGRIESVLSEAGFSETKVALYKLRQSKLIKTKDANRNTYPYVINGTEVNCVAVYFEDKGTEVQDIGDETE